MTPTLLIIDDEPEAARALARLLRLRGWSSIVARTGDEARAIRVQQTPDAIVVDVVGPFPVTAAEDRSATVRMKAVRA